MRRLGELGYQLMNSGDRAESYTVLHLLAGPEQLFASVKLAADGELRQLSEEADPRVSGPKSAAVQRILEAATLGEVLPYAASLKVSFRSLSLQVKCVRIFLCL